MYATSMGYAVAPVHLWEGRYKSALIDTERYLLTCSRYIELNPAGAGLVTGPG